MQLYPNKNTTKNLLCTFNKFPFKHIISNLNDIGKYK